VSAQDKESLDVLLIISFLPASLLTLPSSDDLLDLPGVMAPLISFTVKEKVREDSMVSCLALIASPSLNTGVIEKKDGTRQFRIGRFVYGQVGFLVLILWASFFSLNSETYAANERFFSKQPAPKSVDELSHGMEEHFEERSRPLSLYQVLRKEGRVGRLPDFLADQRLHLKVRTYYFTQDNEDDSTSEAWALGNWLDYDTGWLSDRLMLGGTLYTSGKLYGPSGKDGTKLLLPGQKSFAVLGQAYVRLRLTDEHRLSLFRQSYELPYVNGFDSRMVPNTFEAYSLLGTVREKDLFPNAQYLLGYIRRIKLRDSNHFIDMAEAAGAKGVDRGLAFGGLRFLIAKKVNIGALNFLVPDVLNIFYSEANYLFRPSEEVAVTSQLQFTHQSSVGDDLLTGSDFHTYQVAGSVGISFRNIIFHTAFSTTDDNAQIRSPYGASPSPLNIMVRDFSRAGEDAWLVGLSYNFKHFGLEALSGFVNFAQGFGARGQPNEEEIDVTMDYHFRRGPLRNWWLRVRNGFVNEINGDKTLNNFRVILNYDLPIF